MKYSYLILKKVSFCNIEMQTVVGIFIIKVSFDSL
ncbi:hypothetical protein SAMN05444372_102233 [Flavobacterium micromati]|uniref:Uncharacterized protein n=1 Tax=Flavobacterium micromati TaxID=229205 RepID=A0A1M5H078_9FLAO|nr:hypothetical protein SAMN05444372_102233 [Flavobacterium micromati]